MNYPYGLASYHQHGTSARGHARRKMRLSDVSPMALPPLPPMTRVGKPPILPHC
jgi:hypothetical protein